MPLIETDHAWAVGGAATALAVGLTGRLIVQHLTHMVKPERQLHMIAIILMVPIFAADSFVGLLDIEASETFVMVLDALKECYEAFVIYSFLELMFAYLGLTATSVPKELKGRHLHHTFPFNLFMGDMHLDVASVARLRLWTSQFVYIRPVIAILSVVLQVTGMYDDFYLPISIVLNISVSMAVYALVMFYHAFEKELSPHRPLAQFLCIKGVVFFAFWQSVIIEVAVWRGWIHQDHWYTTDELSTAVQNFLVCLEMGFLFSFANRYAFTAEPYIKAAKALKIK